MTELKDEMSNDNLPASRNKETVQGLCVLAAIWMLAIIVVSRPGGLGAYNLVLFGLFSSVIGGAILFLPMRWLVRKCTDDQKKALLYIAIFIISALFLSLLVLGTTPTYVKDMEQEANRYYHEQRQEFDDPYEGEMIIIRVPSLSGPYVTYFVYTKKGRPEEYSRGIVIDYRDGWYFVGYFAPI